MNKIIAMLALVMAQYAYSLEPNAYESLKPFVTFAKGTGEGVAYHYVNRTKAQFVSLLRDEAFAKKEMRVGCSVLVNQMVEAHPGLPFEGCEGAAAAIEDDDDYKVVACADNMFTQDNFLNVTNSDGSEFDVWHRACYEGEMVLVYKNEPIISLTCLNVVIPVRQQSACYTIPFDYLETDGVVWDDKHRAHVSAHLATETELESVLNDPCFGIIDADGFRKPFHRCETCNEGEYPPKGLAVAVGLMEEEPKGVLSFYLKDGTGAFSMPLSFAERWMLFCVDVDAYSVSVSGYERWTAVSRFDVLKKEEITRTIEKGTYDKALRGDENF